MNRNYPMLTLSFCAIIALGLAGCGGASSDKAASTSNAETSGPPATVEAGHAHPSEGPHGGSLIELGNEEYHAELVHDEQAWNRHRVHPGLGGQGQRSHRRR